MTISEQCCTLEQGRALRKLGMRMEATFYHYQMILNSVPSYPVIPLRNFRGSVMEVDDSLERAMTGKAKNEWAPAYNVAELGAVLPEVIQWGNYRLRLFRWRMSTGEYVLQYRIAAGSAVGAFPSSPVAWVTEAGARAAMLIWLLDSKIIQAENLK